MDQEPNPQLASPMLCGCHKHAIKHTCGTQCQSSTRTSSEPTDAMLVPECGERKGESVLGQGKWGEGREELWWGKEWGG